MISGKHDMGKCNMDAKRKGRRRLLINIHGHQGEADRLFQDINTGADHSGADPGVGFQHAVFIGVIFEIAFLMWQ